MSLSGTFGVISKEGMNMSDLFFLHTLLDTIGAILYNIIYDFDLSIFIQ